MNFLKCCFAVGRINIYSIVSNYSSSIQYTLIHGNLFENFVSFIFIEKNTSIAQCIGGGLYFGSKSQKFKSFQIVGLNIFFLQFTKNASTQLFFINNNKKTIFHSAITDNLIDASANSKTLIDQKNPFIANAAFHFLS